MPTVSELRGSVGLDDTPYQQGLGRVEKATERTARQVAAEWAYLGRQAAAAHREAAREMEAAGAAAGRAAAQQAREWAVAEKEASQLVSQAHRDAQREAEQAARQMTRSHEEAAAKVKAAWQGVSSLGGQLSIGLTAPLLLVGQRATEASMDIEQMKVGLTSLMGSAQAAADEYRRLYNISRAPGLDLQSTLQGARGFIAVGDSAAKAEEKVRQLGNAVALAGGTADKFKGVVQQFIELEGIGKVSERHLKAILTEVPQLMPVIKEAFGSVNAEQIQKTLEENGKSASDFIDILIERMARLPRAGETAANRMRNASNDITIALGKIGDSLVPVELDLVNRLVPAIQGAADWFGRLDGSQKNFVLGVAGFAAGTGPVLFFVSQLATGLKSAMDIGQGAAAFFKGEAVAAEVAHQVAVDADTASIKLNTIALEDNAAALNAQIRAGQASAAPGASAAGRSGIGVFGAAVIAHEAFQGISHTIGMTQNLQRGNYGGAFRDYLQTLGPVGRIAVQGSDFAADTFRLATGQRRHPAAVPATTQAAAVAPASAGGAGGLAYPPKADPTVLQRMSDEAYQAKLAEVAVLVEKGPEDQRARTELQALLPVIRARQAELRKDADAAAEGSKEKLSAVREERVLEEQALRIQHSAGNEARQAAARVITQQKQANQRFAQIRSQVIDAQIAAAREGVADTPESDRARAELKATEPLLIAKMQDLNQQAESLRPLFDATGKAQEEYSKTALQSWAVQAELERKRRAASKEQAQEAVKAAKDARETEKAAGEARAEMLKAQLDATAPEGMKARSEAWMIELELVPKMDRLADELAAMKPATVEFYKKQKELWETQAEITRIADAANKEHADDVKKQVDEQKKRAQDARQLASARVGLVEARAKTLQDVFGLNSNRAARMALPSLTGEFLATYHPVAGENAQERVQRQTEGEQLGNKILETARKAGLNVRQVYAELVALSEIGETGKLDRSAMAASRFAGLSPRMLARDLTMAQRFASLEARGMPNAQPAAKVDLSLREAPIDWERAFRDPRARRALENVLSEIREGYLRDSR